MYSLVYHSTAEPHFTEDQLDDLVERANKKNRRISVTGFLYFESHSKTFLQYLEGGKEQVEGLMAEIEADDRHRVQQVVRFGDRTNRLFKSWSMRQVHPYQLRTIGLDDVLQQALQSIRAKAIDEDRGLEIAEGLVNKIAESQNRLPLAN